MNRAAGSQASQERPLVGQVALVTGGGRGLGRVYAQALAAAGAAVAVTARSADQIEATVALIVQAGGRAIAVPADVSERAAVERLVADVERALGPIDLLVNAAGVAGPVGPLATDEPEDWWRTVEVNLRGPFLCCRAVLPGMLARGRGRIINVSSGAALSPWKLVSAYAVSKAALERLTENLAVEVKDTGVSVFSVHPGVVRTAMSESLARSGVPEVARSFERRFAEGSDVPAERSASLVVFLASGKADALSGRYIPVEEDVDALAARAEEIQQRGLYVLRGRQ